MTTPTIAADLAIIDLALRDYHAVVYHDAVRTQTAVNAMVAWRRVLVALQPSDAGVAVAGADDTQECDEVPTP